MTRPTRFAKQDIGGEILPILTTGLYRDTMDAFREYIQNSIDAHTQTIELIVDPSTITVSDDGKGMSREEARNSIRLGISNKNPIEHVGFRGIGIYSAFNLCNRLEVFTKSEDESSGSHLVFDFGQMRHDLLIEQERRKSGQPSELYLERLLGSAVYVENDSENIISGNGTRVVMSDLLSEAYRPLQDWDKVVAYLEDVVPLPFHPEFKYGNQLAKKFAEEDYRVVPVSLQIGSRKELVYRPYRDDHFSDGVEYPPEYFPITKGKENFGFAWICVNGRRVLREQSIRGLLIKKFGFSIGSRSYLEPFFKRTVFNRRITGEIIVQHQGLLPNAARSDFENNLARQEFLEAIPHFITSLSKWANDIQEQGKAREVLCETREELEKLAEDLPLSQRDKEAMLRATVDLSQWEQKLTHHKKTLSADKTVAEEYAATKALLRNCRALVQNALTTSQKSRKRLEDDVVKVVQSEHRARQASSPTWRPEAPSSLAAALEQCGIRVPKDVENALDLFEQDLLLPQIDSPTYKGLLARLVEVLEEEF